MLADLLFPLHEVFLVVFLCFPENHSRCYLSNDLYTFLNQSIFRFIGKFSLSFGMNENDGTILAAMVWTLPVELGRIVDFPEYVQQLFVSYLFRVKLYQHGFRMLRSVSANVFVCRRIKPSARVTYRCRF